MWKLLISVFCLVVLFSAAAPAQAQVTGTNWTGTYYNNTTMSGGPVANEQYPNGVFFNWGGGPPLKADNFSPVPGVSSENFSAVFTSTQTFNHSSVYTFTIYVDDGMRVYLDGVLVLDQFNQNLTGSYRTFTFQHNITAPDTIDMRVEFVEFTGNAIVSIQWGANTPPLPTIHIYEPRNGSIIDGNPSPTLEWEYVGPLSYKIKLKDAEGDRVFVGTFPGESICPSDCILDLSAPPSMSPVVLADGWHTWRVTAVEIGMQSNWTKFRIQLPGRPFDLTPDNDAVVTTASPVLAWGEVGLAVEYQLRLIHKKTGDETLIGYFPAADAGFNGTTCTIDLAALETPVVLVPGKYKWQVKARDDSGALNRSKSGIATFKVVLESRAIVAPPLPATGFRAP